jgi:FHA domain-containing protein
VLTSTRGTLEVRAHHGRVWSDLVADDDVDTVALRVSPTWVPPVDPAPADNNPDMFGLLRENPAQTRNNPDMSEKVQEPEPGPAPKPAPAPEAGPAPQPEPEPAPEPATVEVHAPSRIPAVEPPPDGGTDLIAAVPWRQPTADPPTGQRQPDTEAENRKSRTLGEEEPPPENPHRDPGDTDATVDRAALLSAATAATAPNTAPPPTGPTVLAVLCTRGHLNPPTSPTCRICGREVPEQQAYETPRPPLGILRLSTGDVVRLDRGGIMGRAPQGPPGLPPDLQPHVVRIASPQCDLSRNHVQVVVEGWQVILRDLDTTNGTTVTPPQSTTTRLRAGDPFVLEPGAVVSMADEVSFTYEVPAEAQQ